MTADDNPTHENARPSDRSMEQAIIHLTTSMVLSVQPSARNILRFISRYDGPDSAAFRDRSRRGVLSDRYCAGCDEIEMLACQEPHSLASERQTCEFRLSLEGDLGMIFLHLSSD